MMQWCGLNMHLTLTRGHKKQRWRSRWQSGRTCESAAPQPCHNKNKGVQKNHANLSSSKEKEDCCSKPPWHSTESKLNNNTTGLSMVLLGQSVTFTKTKKAWKWMNTQHDRCPHFSIPPPSYNFVSSMKSSLILTDGQNDWIMAYSNEGGLIHPMPHELPLKFCWPTSAVPADLNKWIRHEMSCPDESLDLQDEWCTTTIWRDSWGNPLEGAFVLYCHCF